MKKLIACLALLMGASLTAAPVQTSLTYGELGVGPLPLPIPVFGIGYRSQFNHHGFDCSLKLSSVIAVTHLKATLLHHYYFMPDIRSQCYVGAGASIGTLFGSNYRTLLSPEFVFGKQYMNELGGIRFLQAALSFPTLGLTHEKNDLTWMPLVVLSYGVVF